VSPPKRFLCATRVRSFGCVSLSILLFQTEEQRLLQAFHLFPSSDFSYKRLRQWKLPDRSPLPTAVLSFNHCECFGSPFPRTLPGEIGILLRCCLLREILHRHQIPGKYFSPTPFLQYYKPLRVPNYRCPPTCRPTLFEDSKKILPPKSFFLRVLDPR